MIKHEDLIHALRRMAPETGSLHCLGCGYEHSCSTHGCAIIREAAAEMEKLRNPPNPPLTPEELRGMNGEPVWAEIDDFQGWIIIKRASSVFFTTWRFGILLWEEYGKTWLAYRRKPEEGTT